MDKSPINFLKSLLLAVLTCWSVIAEGDVLYVTTDNGLEAAYLDAAGGDTIQLLYEGTLLLDKTLVIDKSVSLFGLHARTMQITGDNVTAFEVAAGAHFTLEHVSLVNTGSSNGAVFVDGGFLYVNHCIFKGNVNDQTGGAIRMQGGEAEVLNSAFISNESAQEGSAIMNDGGVLNIEQCTFFDNQCGGSLGGTVTTLGGGELIMRNSTMCYNNYDDPNFSLLDSDSASAGLAATQTETVTLSYNIIVKNRVRSGGIIGNLQANINRLKLGKVSLDLDGSNFMIAQGALIAPIASGSQLFITDPRVDSTLHYGFGEIPCLLLGTTSPAIDAVPDDLSMPFQGKDTRGYPRLLDGDNDEAYNTDYGAVEMPGIYVTNLNNNGTGSLRAAVNRANQYGATDVIAFALPNSSSSGNAVTYQSIQLTTDLPVIDAPTYIDGFSQFYGTVADSASWKTALVGIHGNGATHALNFSTNAIGSEIAGLGFANFSWVGVHVEAAESTVRGCRFGWPPTNNNAIDSMPAGLSILGAGNQIGQPNPYAENMFAYCASGVVLYGTGATRNSIQRNQFGAPDDTGSMVGNANGVVVGNGANANQIGGFYELGGNTFASNSIASIILDTDAAYNNVVGNEIGLSVDGSNDASASSFGVLAYNGANHNYIGHPISNVLYYGDVEPYLGNFITNTTFGIALTGTNTADNTVESNGIGYLNGLEILNIGSGVVISQGAANNTIGGDAYGANNIITNSLSNGVQVLDLETKGNAIISNLIYNVLAHPILLGIGANPPNDSLDADSGPNGFQNAPFIESLTLCAGQVSVRGRFFGEPATTYRLDFYKSNDAGQAIAHIGDTTITTDATGVRYLAENYDNSDLVAGDQVVMTATHTIDRNTSYFSNVVAIQSSSTGVPVFNLTADVNDFTICQGDSVIVDAEINGGVAPYTVAYRGLAPVTRTYTADGALELTLSPNQSVQYELFRVADANGCVSNANGVIKVQVDDQVIQSQTLSFCPNEPESTFKPEHTSNVEIKWYADIGLVDGIAEGFDFTLDSASINQYNYVVYAPAGEGACANKSIGVSLLPDSDLCLASELTLHHAFSPNDDFLNDTWIIDGITEYPESKLTIHDQWGNLQASFTGYDNDVVVWDGNSASGEKLPFGTYYYRLELSPGGSVQQGWVILTP